MTFSSVGSVSVLRLYSIVWLLCLPVIARSENFRFAWLSDTHVGSPTGADDLRGSVRDINSMNDISFTIISGDVTELGRNVELDQAKSILDSLRAPYYIIPGNHDTKWSESGCTRFNQLWVWDHFDFYHHGYRFIGMHQGPIMRMGDGHFAPEDLRWLDKSLADMPDKNQPIIFVTHYPLDSSIDNWYEVVDRLKRFNTKAVLVGHGHADLGFSFEGIPGVMGRSNLRGRQGLGGYNIVYVRPDTLFFSERIPGVRTRPTWHSVSEEVRTYRADATSYPRPDFSINQKFPFVTPRWRFETGYTIAAAPAVWGGRVIVGDASGTVYCLALNDGAKLWTFQTGGPVYSSADAADGKVVFGSDDRNIYCLDVASGAIQWKVNAHAPVVAVPTISDGRVFIGGGDSTFRSIDLASGSVNWEHEGIGAFVETKPLVYNSRVVFGAWDTYLYSLNDENGSLAWRWSNGNPTLNLSPAACWPVASGQQVYIVAPDRVMSEIDFQTGATLWRSNRYQVRESIGISNDRTMMYAKCMNDTLVAYSTTSLIPRLAWATHCGFGYDIDPSMPREKEGNLYFGTKNGLVYAISASDGKVLWQHRTGVTIVNTVCPLDSNRVVLTDADGSIALLERK